MRSARLADGCTRTDALTCAGMPAGKTVAFPGAPGVFAGLELMHAIDVEDGVRDARQDRRRPDLHQPAQIACRIRREDRVRRWRGRQRRMPPDILRQAERQHDQRIGPRQHRRPGVGLIVADQDRDRPVEPHPPEFLVVPQLIGRPQDPERAPLRARHERQQVELMAGDVEIAGLRRRARQRPPDDALVLDRAVAIGEAGDLMAAPRQLARAADDAGLGAAERTPLEIAAVVMQRRIGKHDAGHARNSFSAGSG